METSELIEILSRGEDSRHQFKESDIREDSLAQEMIALSNTEGGMILVGVTDSGEVEGLDVKTINQKKLDNKISNAAYNQIKPPITVKTENIRHPDGIVIVVSVSKNKFHMDLSGNVFVKNGADKRKVTSPDELLRLFQDSQQIHGDEMPANGITVADIDLPYFSDFLKNERGEDIAKLESPLPQLLENMNLAKSNVLNVTGALLFSQRPQYRLPAFIVKAVSYPGNEITESNYLDSRDITGKMSDIYRQTIGFMDANLRHVQGSKGINSTGELPIPRVVFEELIVNALIHRNYFISAPIRIFIFNNRIEIISPGHLPNNLTIENIKNGVSNMRNPILASFATKILPYRGLGSGIRRALKEYSLIDFFDEKENNLFKAVVKIND